VQNIALNASSVVIAFSCKTFHPTFIFYQTNEFFVGFMSKGANQMDDLQQCWESVLAGDTDSLRIIHEHLYSSLHHYAKSILKDEALADDAIQDIFIKAWTQREKIGKLQHVKAFFFTMLRRHNLNQLRSFKTRLLHLGLPTSSQE